MLIINFVHNTPTQVSHRVLFNSRIRNTFLYFKHVLLVMCIPYRYLTPIDGIIAMNLVAQREVYTPRLATLK
jgi:hypothetical protein